VSYGPAKQEGPPGTVLCLAAHRKAMAVVPPVRPFSQIVAKWFDINGP
jgi:hypothetical protein